MSKFSDGYICANAEIASGILWDLSEILKDELSEDELKIIQGAIDICDQLTDEIVDKTDVDDLP